MNFSRFFKYSFPFFLLCSIANTTKPIGFNDSSIGFAQPLFFEIPKIPLATPCYYTSILADKGNRLFITNDHDVFIYDGVNYQQIKVTGKPVVAYDGSEKIVIAGYNYLALLTQNTSGGYDANQLIDPVVNHFKYQITSIGFDDSKNINFSTGSKLWKYIDKAVAMDSSKQEITIYSTSNGLTFHSIEKGFYCIKGNKDNIFNEIRHYINTDEVITKISTAGSYFFISTSSNRLLMFNNQGKPIKNISAFGDNNSEMPINICSSDDINFFAITSTQIFRFINPLMVEIFNANSNLKGTVRSTIVLDKKLFIATSFALYVASDLARCNSFTILQKGSFTDLYLHNNNLFAINTNGLFHISDNRVVRITPEMGEFQKSCIVDSKQPKALFLNSQGVYYTTLDRPFSLKKLSINNNLLFTNFYSTDSTLLLNTSTDKWFTTNAEFDKFSEENPIESKIFSPQFFINGDTLSLVNERIVIKNKTGYRSKIGKTFSNQPITGIFSSIHPNFQAFVFNRIHNYADFAIENSFQVNEVYLDSDSTAWLSTNSGLIKISIEYLKRIKAHQPSLILFSACTNNNGVSTILSNIYSQTNHIRIKQGRSAEINLSGIGTTGWNNLSYSFKPDNNDLKWSERTPISTILFDRLKPGNHSYTFKARDAIGIESAELKVNITVTPNFIQTRSSLIAFIILVLLIIYTIFRWRIFYFSRERFKLESIINRRTDELVKEKEKTDNLLARVLPRETAAELKETGKVLTQKFNMATVLFSDIQGFTKITDELNPENLIDQLDKFFLYFDSVVDKYRIEKIKTIGDAYMCAGGIPHKNRTNPVEVVLAALEMLSFMREINLEHNPGQDIWDLRIGIDTGPVIAGVVGRNKLSYDIWGTTVNTASRMESSGEVGRINISGNTHIFVQDYFICTYRGKMPIKNKGDIEMYFVDGIKPALSNNLDLYRPNNEFQVQLQFLRFGDLEEFILEKLEKGLPQNLYYHNLKHTVDVYTQVELIGRSEDVSQEEQLLLQTAALFHDAGHLIDYDTHEEMGVKLAREILPEYQYSERQIEIISNLIMITKLPPKPKNLLEAIMCDADLDYLGRTDFIPVSNMLYKELHEHGRIGTIQDWNELQIKFIEKHQYFTNTARRLRNVNKNSQLENIKNWIEKNKL